MNNDQKKLAFKGVVVLLGIGFVFAMATFVIPKVLVTVSKASFSPKVSISNSFLIGEKIAARADGQDKCVVNAFVLDTEGKGVANKQVKIVGLNTFEAVTNEFGKANFELNSDVAGQYELVGSVDGVKMPRTLKVTFK